MPRRGRTRHGGLLNADLAYTHYWARKELLKAGAPRFPVRRWWDSDDLCEIERIYFDAVRGSSSLLDVGAGDLRVMDRLRRAGYAGEYHTQDVGGEREHTYRSLDEIHRKYGAVLCLDVLEHLPLEGGLAMLERLVGILEPGGTLVLQTPNARYIPHPLSWDMTHLHCYNLEDLWAHLSCKGLDVRGYRLLLEPPPRNPVRTLRLLAGAVLRGRLGCDHAHNIALIARTPRGTVPSSP